MFSSLEKGSFYNEESFLKSLLNLTHGQISKKKEKRKETEEKFEMNDHSY